VDATVIGAIFTGLSAVLAAWAHLSGQRRNAAGAELREIRRERKRLQAQVDALRRWGLRLEVLLIEKRIDKIPRRPPQFDSDWGREDDEERPKRLRLVSR
jgi:hypothetical protein